MERDRRRLATGAAVVLAAIVAGCGIGTSGPAEAPWKDGSAEEEPQAPSNGLAAACPTFAEARAAVPAIVSGPDANDSPFKNMVLQCSYELPGLDPQMRPRGVAILVFDASAEGATLWDSVRTDPAFPNASDIPGLGEVGFATGEPGRNDVWVVEGRYGFHMLNAWPDGVPLDQMVALARAMLAGLARSG